MSLLLSFYRAQAYMKVGRSCWIKPQVYSAESCIPQKPACAQAEHENNSPAP